MPLIYLAVTCFCAGWSLFFLLAAFTRRSVSSRGIRLSSRSLIVVAVLCAWVGVVSATGFMPALAEMLSLYKGALIFAGLVAVFIVSLAVDARRT